MLITLQPTAGSLESNFILGQAMALPDSFGGEFCVGWNDYQSLYLILNFAESYSCR